MDETQDYGPVKYLVPLEWNEPMRTEAFAIADEFTLDPEKRAFIVGVLLGAWPRLLSAAVK